jgi:endonuclease/exonuclease/phosphatase family metal-dependent hydrolase
MRNHERRWADYHVEKASGSETVHTAIFKVIVSPLSGVGKQQRQHRNAALTDGLPVADYAPLLHHFCDAK